MAPAVFVVGFTAGAASVALMLHNPWRNWKGVLAIVLTEGVFFTAMALSGSLG